MNVNPPIYIYIYIADWMCVKCSGLHWFSSFLQQPVKGN